MSRVLRSFCAAIRRRLGCENLLAVYALCAMQINILTKIYNIDFDINVIPFNQEYVEKIRDNIGLIGNKRLFLKSDEVEYYL